MTTTSGTIGDQLARRCLSIIKTALKSDIWPENNIDIRLQWVDKLLCSLSSPNPNIGNICTALELVTFVFSVMKKEDVLALCKLLQNGICLCISSPNPKVLWLVFWGTYRSVLWWFTHFLRTRSFDMFTRWSLVWWAYFQLSRWHRRFRPSMRSWIRSTIVWRR